MTVTVDPDAAAPRGPLPGDTVSVPSAALVELGVPVGGQTRVGQVVAGRAWCEPVAELADQIALDGDLDLVVAALAARWVSRRRPDLCDLRPATGQVRLARELVASAGQYGAGLVAHVCARVLPAHYGAAVADVHSHRACLALVDAWCRNYDDGGVAPARVRAARKMLARHVNDHAAGEHRPAPEPGSPQWRAEEAELVAWRLGAALGLVRWADSPAAQARITGGRALFAAWTATLPRPDRLDLADALAEAWAAWTAKERTGFRSESRAGGR